MYFCINGKIFSVIFISNIFRHAKPKRISLYKYLFFTNDNKTLFYSILHLFLIIVSKESLSSNYEWVCFYFLCRFTVRDFTYNEQALAAGKDQLNKLAADKKRQYVSNSIVERNYN